MVRKENLNIYIRRFVFTVAIILVAAIQNTPHLFPTIFGARAFLLIPLVVCIAMFERGMAGAVFGAFAGMLWDFTLSRGDGFNTLFLMAIGIICGLLINYLMRNNLVTAILLTSITLLLYSLCYWLVFIIFRGIEGGASTILTFYLPSALYSLVLMPIFYFSIRSYMKRVRSRQYKNI